MADTYCSRKLL